MIVTEEQISLPHQTNLTTIKGKAIYETLQCSVTKCHKVTNQNVWYVDSVAAEFHWFATAFLLAMLYTDDIISFVWNSLFCITK